MVDYWRARGWPKTLNVHPFATLCSRCRRTGQWHPDRRGSGVAGCRQPRLRRSSSRQNGRCWRDRALRKGPIRARRHPAASNHASRAHATAEAHRAAGCWGSANTAPASGPRHVRSVLAAWWPTKCCSRSLACSGNNRRGSTPPTSINSWRKSAACAPNMDFRRRSSFASSQPRGWPWTFRWHTAWTRSGPTSPPTQRNATAEPAIAFFSGSIAASPWNWKPDRAGGMKDFDRRANHQGRARWPGTAIIWWALPSMLQGPR
jgi:hypothetical protein